MEFYQSPDGRPLPRPKVTIYNPQQGCPVAQQKGGFGGAGAGVDARTFLRGLCEHDAVHLPADNDDEMEPRTSQHTLSPCMHGEPVLVGEQADRRNRIRLLRVGS